MKFIKKQLFFAAVFIMIFSLTACSKNEASVNFITHNKKEDAEKFLKIGETTVYNGVNNVNNFNKTEERKNTLVIGSGEFSDTFNPYYVTSIYDTYPLNAVYESLLGTDDKGEVNKEQLAELPEISEDKKTYTFRLNGSRWSDGEIIKPEDVEIALKIICDSDYDGPFDFIGGDTKIKGALEYKKRKAENISGFKKINEETFSITLNEPSSFAIYSLGELIPLPSQYYEEYYKNGKIKETFLKPGPASGPYKFKQYIKGSEARLEKNDNYHGKKAEINSVVYKAAPADTRLQMLEAGDIDVALEVQADNDNIEEIKEKGFLSCQIYPQNGYSYIGLNCSKGPLKEKSVRQALNYALNRELITKSVYGSCASVLNCPQTKVSWAYSEVPEKYEYNIEKAKQLLDEAGWIPGKNGIREKNGVKLEINYSGSIGSKTSENIIACAANDFKEIGVRFTSQMLDFPTLVSKTAKGELEAWGMGWELSDNPDCHMIFGKDAPYNRGKFESPEAEEIFLKLPLEFDREKQKELFKELYKVINDECPYIFLNQSERATVYNSRIEGLDDGPFSSFTQKLNYIKIK